MAAQSADANERAAIRRLAADPSLVRVTMTAQYDLLGSDLTSDDDVLPEMIAWIDGGERITESCLCADNTQAFQLAFEMKPMPFTRRFFYLKVAAYRDLNKPDEYMLPSPPTLIVEEQNMKAKKCPICIGDGAWCRNFSRRVSNGVAAEHSRRGTNDRRCGVAALRRLRRGYSVEKAGAGDYPPLPPAQEDASRVGPRKRRGDKSDHPLHPVQPPARNRHVHGDGQTVGGVGGVCEGVLIFPPSPRISAKASAGVD